MPTLDHEAALRAQRREYLKSLRKGDMITCALPMRAVAMRVDGRLCDFSPEPSKAELEAEKRRKADADYLALIERVGI
jgi:hypothetical protein